MAVDFENWIFETVLNLRNLVYQDSCPNNILQLKFTCTFAACDDIRVL